MSQNPIFSPPIFNTWQFNYPETRGQKDDHHRFDLSMNP